MSDIIISGVGLVSALGHTRAEVCAALCAGRRPFVPITRFYGAGFRVALVAEAKEPDLAARFGKPALRHTSHTDRLALAAAAEAITEARLDPELRRKTAIFVGAGSAGMAEMEAALARGAALGLDEYLPFAMWSTSRVLARVLGLGGPRATYMTACSSAAHALGIAASRLRSGELTCAIAGGAEGLSRLTLAGFGALGILDPEGARPFAADRAGLTLGEGAAFFVLETRANAQRRGVTPLAVLAGYGTTTDAHHMVHPRPDARGAVRAIEAALKDAGLSADDIDYVNAHGTATQQNDSVEALALREVFGERPLLISSSKSMLGHTLGAAAALEAAAVVLGMQGGFIPPNPGVGATMAGLGRLRLVRETISRAPRAVLSTSLAFGGNNAALILTAPDLAPRLTRARRSLRHEVVISGAALSCERGTAHDARAITALLDAPNTVRLDATAIIGARAARRMDTLSAQVAAICVLARAAAGVSGELGVGLGTAFGNLDGTAGFLARLFDKGPALVSPRDFPNLVHNAAAGHAAIVLEAEGSSLAASEAELSADEAFAVMFEKVREGKLLSALAAGADLESAKLTAAYAIIDRITRTRSVQKSVIAALVLEREAALVARGATPWAKVICSRAGSTSSAAVTAVLACLAPGVAVDLWLRGTSEHLAERHEEEAARSLPGVEIICARALLGPAAGGGAAVLALAAALVHEFRAGTVLVTSVTREGQSRATILGRALPNPQTRGM